MHYLLYRFKPIDKKYLITLLLFINVNLFFSQDKKPISSPKVLDANFQITMLVKDSTNNQPLEFVTASLFRYDSKIDISDKKEVYDYSLSDSSGKIVFQKLSPWYKYDIVLEYLGFHPLIINNVFFLDGNSLDSLAVIKDLGIKYMKESSFLLDEAKVKATTIPVKMIGDTIQYNASAFDIKESDMLEDFFRKLPGWAIDKNGRITVNGSILEQITVNGRTFFTSDPSYVSKILPARLVQNVKVFDKRSEELDFLGIDDGNSKKTADVKTKNEINGWVGNSNASVGLKSRYKTDGMLAKFDKQNQYAFIGTAANIPKSVSTSVGNINSFSAGSNVNTAINKNSKSIKSDFSYTFNKDNKDSKMEFYQKNYLSDNIIIDDQIKIEDSKNGIHKFMAGLTLNSGSDYMIVAKANYFKTTNTDNNTKEYSSKTPLGDTINYGYGKEFGNSDVNRGGVSLSIIKKFTKTGRALRFNVSIDYSSSQKISNNNYFVSNSDSVINVNQQSATSNNYISLTSGLTYSQPVFKNLILSFQYNVSSRINEMVKNTYNKGLNDSYSILVKDYSGEYTNMITDQSFSLTIMPKVQNKEKLSYTIGLNISPLIMKFLNDSSIFSNKVTNIAPELNLSYNKAGVGKFIIQYKGNSKPPSINQLQPIKDNSNPVYITNGNPNLNPEFNNTLLLGIGRSTDPKRFFDRKQKSENSYGNRSLTFISTIAFNKIIMKSWYDDFGVKYTMPVNEDGFYTLGFRYDDIAFFNENKFFLTGKLEMMLNKGFSYINSIKIASKSLNSSANLNLTTKFEDIDFIIGVKAENISNQYSIVGKPREIGWVFNYSGDVVLKLPGDFIFRSDINIRKYTGFISGSDDLFTIWNAFLSKPLFRRRVDLTLSAYDILNQNSNILKTYSDNYLLITKSNNIKQLFLIGFTYRFYLGNKTGIAKERASRVIDMNYKNF